MSAERLRVGVGVEVRVPASSANLGPGFDSVGCALGVWDTCRAAVTDEQILAAHRVLSAEVGIFVEPASASGVAGLLMLSEQGRVPAGARIVITVTGHGLKDPQWALRTADGSDVVPVRISSDVVSIATALGLD